MGVDHRSHGVDSTTDDSRDRRLRHGSASLQRELNGLADLIGRKWNLVIIAELLYEGPMGFSDIENSVDGISNKVLSESLQTLEEHGVVDRDVLSERPFRVEYSLTQQGAAFEPVIARVREGDLRVTPP